MLPSKLTTKSLVKPIPIVLKGLGAGTMDGVGTRVITITATPTNATAFVVNLDGQQLALGAGQPSTRPISQGAHMMTAIVFGNQGASLSVSGVIAGQAGVSCHCTVDPAGNPGADPEPFNVT